MNNNAIAQVQNITITSKVNQDKSIDLLYTKKNPGSYTLGLAFSNVTNTDIRDYKKVIQGYSGMLVKLRPAEINRRIEYSLWYYSIMGDLNPKADTLFKYSLPFKKGKQVKINMAKKIADDFFIKPSFSGKKEILTDQSDKQQNKVIDSTCATCNTTKKKGSYIVESQMADTICSMRKGLVVKIIDEYFLGSANQSAFKNKRNFVIIEHADGTMARYTGFKKNGIFVELGDTVYPETELGVLAQTENGNYRLDFSVYYMFDKNFKSHEKVDLKNYKSMYKIISPYFVTQEGEVIIESGKEYTTSSDEAVITQEFSRSEKKKYIKQHSVSK